jgi:tetratricopeptide (TPR) repeat protein
MKPEDSVEKAIREEFRFAARSKLRDRMLNRALDAQEEYKKGRLVPAGPATGRTTMKSPIVKLAVAAAIGIAVVLSVSLWNKSTPAAYALGQTVEALQNVRFLHIKGYDDTGRLKDERWIEIGMDGWQVRYRQQNPSWLIEQYPGVPSMVIEDGESTAVYRSGKQAVILYDRKDMQYQWVGELGKAFENLRQEGTILEEDSEYQGRPAHKVWWPFLAAECYIDPTSKLPLAIGDTELSYEEPPVGTFDIVVPDGYATVDMRPGAEPSQVPDWLVAEEQARQRGHDAFRQATQALAEGDFSTAAEQFEVAVQESPGRNWAWFWLGSAYYGLGQYELAIEKFTQVLEMFEAYGGGGEEPLGYCNYARGLAYAQLGRQAEAEADLQACLPAMVRTLRLPSSGSMFEYAENPLIRYGQYKPSDSEIVAKMVNRLRTVSGQNFGYDPDASAEENEAAIAAWEQWLATDARINVTFDAESPETPPAASPQP